ncbi:hypothetical protein MLD38_007237 [Melastoma candidum]|uniref:Uncharacterized protein n=1 Tax=Melastoma candidum TaxID=119954 RepID=A0ACB9RQL1_9MYRT|nr:hypothetical protein MLD38_007237 [Melastoma candidum]
MEGRRLGNLIHTCCKLKSQRQGFPLHALSIKSGLSSDTTLSNHFINFYAKCCRSIPLALRVFDDLPHPNLVSWSSLISGCTQSSHHSLALHLFTRLPFPPNDYIYAPVLCSCTSLGALTLALAVHAHSIKFAYSHHSFVSNSLISMYMKLGRCSDAFAVYADIIDPNVVTYNSIIAGCIENSFSEMALQVFKLMHRQDVVLDKFSFVVLSSVSPELDNLSIGTALQCLAIKLDLHSLAFSGNLIMTMYAKFSLGEQVEIAFRSIEDADVISWNCMISSCCQCLDHAKSLAIFKEMLLESNLQPDEYTFASMLSACAGLSLMRHGKQIHAHLIVANMSWDDGVNNGLVNMYAKCGLLPYACTIFEQMPLRTLVSWNTMISAYGNHGLAKRAIDVYEEMLKAGPAPDSVTYLGLLVACNHSGLVDQGVSYFNSMTDQWGISPDLEHFSCLVDLLGRAGRILEAEELLDRYSFGNDPIILGSLLSASRLHGNTATGERLAKKLLKFQPTTTSPYVLLSNLYASDETWGSVAEARKMLKVSGLKKESGHSLIDVDGAFIKFSMEDFSNLKMEEMTAILKHIRQMVLEVSSDNPILDPV